ncbi:hypothetical protein [Fibrobacter succinogenes]|uniref:hypothetical protein n=1 Tax=Fibrobacter succinogenes TaxID=833 RepID=UPI001565CEE5|nr:hypothetical protein [Fibrobacter succinogenes]
MSLTKKWKLILASLSFAFFTACAGGSNGGSSDGYAADDEGTEEVSGSGSTSKKKVSAPKEVIDENKLKKTEDEAMAANEENHKLRKEIFDAKNKLGIPVERPDAE